MLVLLPAWCFGPIFERQVDAGLDAEKSDATLPIDPWVHSSVHNFMVPNLNSSSQSIYMLTEHAKRLATADVVNNTALSRTLLW